MRIYVEESSYIDNNLKHPITTYTSDIVPRKGELLFFVHYGSYMVTDITYRISDDTENNRLMWIELKVVKVSD